MAADENNHLVANVTDPAGQHISVAGIAEEGLPLGGRRVVVHGVQLFGEEVGFYEGLDVVGVGGEGGNVFEVGKEVDGCCFWGGGVCGLLVGGRGR